MSISDGDYNRALEILVGAGSRTADVSHVKHTQGKGSPDGHGVALLAQARDDFRLMDNGQTPLEAGMTIAHHDAIKAAAKKMGIKYW